MCHPAADGGKHINGVLDKGFKEMTCVSCHGDPKTGDSSPPLGTKGEKETGDAAVGAHEAHLGPSDWHRAGVCADCHAIPASTLHADGKTDFLWGDTANADGASPQYDTSKATCSSVYCHGTTLIGAKAGGSVKREPIWTQVDGTFKACGASCHTNPPGGGHTDNGSCNLCHGQVINSMGQIVNPPLHIDGKVDVGSFACNACHGSADNNAPPTGTNGETATSTAAVGAHQSHLKDGPLRTAVACGECHLVPTDFDSEGHVEVPPAEVTWGSLAKTGDAAPSWDRVSATCSAVYCHGATLSGGSKTEPVWTTVDGTYNQCGACHGAPPPWPHTYKSTCHDCHPGTVAAGGAVDVAGGKHVDGELQIDTASLTCSSCHGGTENAAPPLGTRGESGTTEAAVGAHQAHLETSAWHRDGQCADCHIVPQSVDHSDGKTDFEWGAVSKADGVSPAYDTGTRTCATTYCHGTTLKGAKSGGTVNRTPEWTKVDGTYKECGTTCHTLPPGGGHAPAPTGCLCHGSVVTSVNAGPPATATWKNKDLHINGKVDY
jgi:predicted CxxxxCH...CXXCH cytochrome family protein